MKKNFIERYLTVAERCTRILKALMVTLALLLVCDFANALQNHTRIKTRDEVIETYLDAVVRGHLVGINNVIDENARFYIERGVRVQTTGKRQVLDFLKTNAGIEQDCNCSTAVLQEGDNFLVEKVEMKYNAVTRTDVITAQLSDDGWKITKVETSFK